MKKERVYDVAQYIYDSYKKLSGQIIDEMKLHKLLYFTQRESLAILNEPMFDATFEGWKYGPVCREIREIYTEDGLNTICGSISFESSYIINNVLNEYGQIESWELSRITHKEVSWRNSRIGLSKDDIGDVQLKLEDIRIDAKKVRPFDYQWGMYYDEFEDAEDVA